MPRKTPTTQSNPDDAVILVEAEVVSATTDPLQYKPNGPYFRFHDLHIVVPTPNNPALIHRLEPIKKAAKGPQTHRVYLTPTGLGLLLQQIRIGQMRYYKNE